MSDERHEHRSDERHEHRSDERHEPAFRPDPARAVLAIEDPLDVEELERDRTEDLLGELGPMAPDPEDFARGVAERIAAEEAREARLQALPDAGALRWAAGILPPILLPKGISKLGLGAGGAAASKVGLKAVPGVALLPAVTVLMVAVTLVVALRGILTQRTDADQTDDRGEAQVEVAAWWRRNLVPAGIALAVIIVLWFRAPHDALVLLLLASTLALVGVTGSLARAGFATRLELGRRLGGTMGIALFWGIQLSNATQVVLPGPLGTGWIVPVLSLAAALCLGLAYSERRGGLGRSMGLALGVWAVVLGLVGAGLSAIGEVRVDADDVRSWVVADEDPELAEPLVWEDALASLRRLEAAGQAPPDLGPLTARVAASLADPEFNSTYLWEPLLAGLVTPGPGSPAGPAARFVDPTAVADVLEGQAFPAFHRSAMQDLFLTGDRGAFEVAAVAWAREAFADVARAHRITAAFEDGSENGDDDPELVRARAVLVDAPPLARQRFGAEQGARWLALFDEGVPSDAHLAAEARAAVARKLVAALEEPGDWEVLQKLVDTAALLRWLGHEDLVPGLAPVAHRALLDTWTPTDDGRLGAFPGGTQEDDRGADGRVSVRRLTFVWVDTTATAVEALAIWGLPPVDRPDEPAAGGAPVHVPVDLEALERYLVAESRVFRSEGMDGYAAMAVSSLALLRSLPGFEAEVAALRAARPPMAVLAEHRLLLAALLFAGFSLVATWRAPSEPAEPVAFKTDLQRSLLGQREDQLPAEGITWRTFLRRATLDARAEDPPSVRVSEPEDARSGGSGKASDDRAGDRAGDTSGGVPKGDR